MVTFVASTQVGCVGGYPLNGCNTVIKTGRFVSVSVNILAVNTLTTNPKINTVIPRLTKIIRSGITFVSRNIR